MQELKGKVAFVTGAASGIGLGICKAAAKAGMKVMMADIEASALKGVVPQLEAMGADVDSLICDVADRASVFAAAGETLKRFGKTHLLCNNAGVATGGRIENSKEGDWEWVVGVNFMGVVYGCQAFVPHFKTHGEGGHIVNTSSMAGLLGSYPEWGPYNSTKFAVVGLTEVLRQEGKNGGYSATVLCPGGVATNILDAARNRAEQYSAQKSPVATGVKEDLKQALNPDVVGELVIEAVRADKQYLFTDPRFAKRLIMKPRKDVGGYQLVGAVRSAYFRQRTRFDGGGQMNAKNYDNYKLSVDVAKTDHDLSKERKRTDLFLVNLLSPNKLNKEK